MLTKSVQLLSATCALLVVFMAYAMSSKVMAAPIPNQAALNSITGTIAYTNPFPEPQPVDSNIWLITGDGSQISQTTNFVGTERYPALSPDGSQIVYMAYRDNRWALQKINTDGTNAITLPVAGDSQRPAWSPDGKQIAYQNDTESFWQVWIMDSDGMYQRRLTSNTIAAGHPRWSPDGQKLVYAVEPQAYYEDLHTINSDGTNERLMLSATATGYSYHIPAWSPTRDEIVVARYPAGSSNGPYDLWLYATNGTNGRFLASGIDSPNWNNLSWSTDGNWIIFGKEGNIWRVHRSGYGLAQITTNGGWEPSSNVSYPDLEISTVYLPLFSSPVRFKGIHGRVTYNGSNVSGVGLDLRFFNGTAWSTAAITSTEYDGTYFFTSASSLGPGQKYYVRFVNSVNDPGRLWLWATSVVTGYTSGTELSLADFDIGEITLVSPQNNATEYLPATFQWSRRQATPTDSYALTFRDRNNATIVGQTVPLGYVDSVTIGGLSSKMSMGVPYAWEVWALSPDWGYGISYGTRVVTFGARSGLAPGTNAQSPLEVDPTLERALDLPSRPEP